jgi:hypothetical protein
MANDPEVAMPQLGAGTLEDRIDRLEERLEHLVDAVARIGDEVESGFAAARKTTDQEFRQLKQAITFWGGRARATR